MSIIDKAKKNQTLYIEGMLEAIKKSEASCVHFFENIFGQQQIPEELAEVFELMRDAYVPASAAISYALNYKKERLPINRIEATPIIDVPDWNEIFGILTTLPADLIQTIVNKTECDYGVKRALVSSITDINKDGFVEIVNGYGKEIDFLIKAAAYYEIQNFKFDIADLEPGEASVDEMIDISSEVGEQLGVPSSLFSQVLEPLRDIEQTPTAIKDLFIGAYKSLLFVLFSEYDNYTTKELEIINQYIKQPKYLSLYESIKEEYADEYGSTPDGNHDKGNVVNPIFLPDNFFNREHRTTGKDSVGIIEDKYLSKGVSAYCTMINFLADWKYIDADIETKRNFAFKLSGYHKEYDKGEIHWHGDTNILSVLIQKICNSYDKWDRAKRMFKLDTTLYNSSTLRRKNASDKDFAQLFSQLYEVDLYK